MATLAEQVPVITGLALNLGAASVGGDELQPGNATYLVVRNGDASSTTVTVVVPGTEYEQPRPDVPVVVAPAATEIIGPLGHDLAGSNGRVGVTYSKVTSLTVAVIDCG